MKFLSIAALASWPLVAAAEIQHHGGSGDALPYEKYVRVVSEGDSPVQQAYVKAKDGVYVAAAIRKPKGNGPFPAIVVFHGAPAGRGMEQLVGWSRGATGGPVWERFLQEGFVVVVADYRDGDWNTMNTPSSSGLVTAIDDGLAVIDYVKALPYVDASRLSLYGVSLGGNLVSYLISKVPTIHAAILGAPASLWFLGVAMPAGRLRGVDHGAGRSVRWWVPRDGALPGRIRATCRGTIWGRAEGRGWPPGRPAARDGPT